MFEYRVDALVALFRLILWFLIPFVWLPRRLFPTASARPWTHVQFDYMVRMSFATILIVLMLVFLHLYDLASLIASFFMVHLDTYGEQAYVNAVRALDYARLNHDDLDLATGNPWPELDRYSRCEGSSCNPL